MYVHMKIVVMKHIVHNVEKLINLMNSSTMDILKQ